MSIWNLAYKIIIDRIKFIPILNYIDYKKENSIKLLEEKFEWKRYGGKHYESIFTRFFQGYLLPNKYSYDKRKVHLSNLIMSGQISRDDAIREIEKDPYPSEALLKEDKNFFLKKFNYSEDEFISIMKTKPRDPNEFKSYQGMIEKLKPMVLKIKEFAKGN